MQLRLKPKRHFPFVARHPWVHSHALSEDGAGLTVGQAVELLANDGLPLAKGLVNPAGKLRVRLYSFDGQEIDDGLLHRRIDAAIARRRLAGGADAGGGERLVFSESDLISGLIVDRYADTLSVSFTSAALATRRATILNHLRAAVAAAGTPVRGMMVSMDEKTAKFEGCDPFAEFVGEGQPATSYVENGLKLTVDLSSGQKTGGYLDQRNNHAAAAKYLSGRRVLDVCCYHGGFGLVALSKGAASVVGVDSSRAALENAEATAATNGLSGIEFLQGDCFDVLDGLHGDGERFDAVILDPPRFAGSRHQTASALRAYHRLNASAIKLLPPGGILVTCSCSGRITAAEFAEMLGEVGRASRRDIVILENRGAAADHPVAVSCPESRYLKCIIAAVM